MALQELLEAVEVVFFRHDGGEPEDVPGGGFAFKDHLPQKGGLASGAPELGGLPSEVLLGAGGAAQVLPFPKTCVYDVLGAGVEGRVADGEVE